MTENLIPQQMLENLGPERVTPGVVYLCSEDAPSGIVLQAMGGRFSVAAIVENQGADLGGTPTVEAVAENWGKISDLTGAKPRAR
jgi:hypothetical protein